MPDIRFRCSECRSKLKIGDTSAGQTVTCPVCRAALKAPTVSDPDLVPTATTLPPGVLSVEMKFLCPECSAKLCVDIRDCGTRATCPACAKGIQVPDLPVMTKPPPSSSGTRAALLTEDEIAFLSVTEH